MCIANWTQFARKILNDSWFLCKWIIFIELTRFRGTFDPKVCADDAALKCVKSTVYSEQDRYSRTFGTLHIGLAMVIYIFDTTSWSTAHNIREIFLKIGKFGQDLWAYPHRGRNLLFRGFIWRNKKSKINSTRLVI